MRFPNGIFLLFLSFTIIACGPSPEAIAGQTAIAATTVAAGWTPTPPPSKTPTFTPTSSPTVTPEPGRHYEEEGGFSYNPPDSWTIGEIPGFVYKAFSGLESEVTGANILALDEAFEGPLEGYVEANIITLESVFDPIEIIEQREFSTASGLAGFKLVVDTVQQGLSLRQIMYFFDAGERKLLLVCSRLADAPEEIEILCDDSALTFRLENQ